MATGPTVSDVHFPQDRVTDHRASLTKHNLQEVLDGDIDDFVDALSEIEQAKRIEEAGL